MMGKRFINKKAKELAKRLHSEEHTIMKSKLDHKAEDWYYLMAAGIFENLVKEVDLTELKQLKKTIRTNNVLLRQLVNKINYLWQTLEEQEKKK